MIQVKEDELCLLLPSLPSLSSLGRSRQECTQAAHQGAMNAYSAVAIVTLCVYLIDIIQYTKIIALPMQVAINKIELPRSMSAW